MLLGRGAERRRMDDTLAACRQGAGAGLLLHGEAGIGKTTLLDYAAERAEGMRLLRVEGIESEMDLAYGGLHQLFLPVPEAVDGLPAPQAAAIRAVFGLSDRAVPDRLAIRLAVLSMVSDLSARSPLLCLIDDVQWLDQATVDVLTFVARRLATEAAVMLFAARDGAQGSVVRGLPLLHVTGIDREAAAALVHDLPPPVAERIIEQAQGNPLALLDLPAVLTPAQRAGQLSPLVLPEAPSALRGRLQESFAQQIDRLPDATRAALVVAAADDTGELALVLGAARRMGAGLEDLEPAERAGLLLLSSQVLRFRHPLARHAAYQGAPLIRRIAAHQALAATLDTGRHAHRRAWHLAAAATGPDERVAAELEHVAEWAGDRQAMASASAAYERAAQLTEDPRARARRLIRAARKSAEAGQDERAGTLADQVSLPDQDPGTAAEFARVRAVVELGYGSPAAAGRILLDCVDTLSPCHPDELASLLTDAVHAAFSSADTDLIREIAHRAPDLPVLAVPAFLLTGRVPAALEALRTHVPACRLPETGVMDRLMTGTYCRLVGSHQDAHEIAADAVELCRSQGIGGWLPTTLHLLALTDISLGRLGQAQAHAAEALQLADSYDLDHRAAHLRAVLAVPAAVRGREGETRSLAGQALEYTRPRGIGQGTAAALWALGLLELGLGRAREALEHLEAAAEEAGHPLLAHFLLPDLAEAAVRAGFPRRAAEPASLLADWAEVMTEPAISAVARRCAALTGPDDAAEDHFTAALSFHEGGSDFERARTLLLHGEWLRRMRRHVDARDRLRAALQVFEGLDAQPWARRARIELRAAGGDTVPAGTPDTPISRLSPQEREIVRLAATGATNRDIATQLFLSPRTVGHHLYRAYPKLGISSRTELASLLPHETGAE
ncbi:helix-turn-helix transcriptional regulator [Streptomyces sp. ALB3]|uniref:helix-turn-helix transcriptional regulator n=1 Tax=Streptomyces sp. ALB3 TaxID=3374278 RepID=UPI0037B387A7